MWLFALIIFLIPSNLAKHFPQNFSYVNGYLVDYLIPTVYLTDILIVILLFLKPVKKIPRPLIVFLSCLLPSVIFSHSIGPAIYKWLKFLEIGLLAAWIKQYRPSFAKPLTAAIVFQSILALGQWLNHKSLFGYWFFGEQPYTPSTPGVDKITWFDGSLKTPPLGTTPHPNILAGFLVIGTTLLADKISSLAIFFAAIPLFFTFSLSGWLAFIINKKRLIIPALALMLAFSPSLSFLAPESSFSRRSELAKISLKMFLDKPLSGVGLNNFTAVMENYGYISSTVRFLQPVHNIYLLILSETGLLGMFGFLYLLAKIKPNRCLLLLLFLGLFDHWPLTLQQGLLIISLTLLAPA